MQYGTLFNSEEGAHGGLCAFTNSKACSTVFWLMAHCTEHKFLPIYERLFYRVIVINKGNLIKKTVIMGKYSKDTF